MADQLTLFKPRGADYARQTTASPPPRIQNAIYTSGMYVFKHFLANFQRTNEQDFYPVHLPDDVPVDFLVGNMDLLVTLPTQKSVRMSVERRYVL